MVNMRFFISSSFRVGSLRAPLQPDGQCWRHMAKKPETSNPGNEIFFLVTDTIAKLPETQVLVSQ